MTNESPDSQGLLTVADVARWLTVSASLVYQLVDAGKLPVHRIGNGRGAIRFRPADIEEYLDDCRIEPSVAKPERKLRPQLKHIQLE